MLRLLAILAFALPATAAEVVVVNATAKEQAFTVRHTATAAAVAGTVPAGELRVVAVGKASQLQATLNGTPATFHLDPYAAYVFAADRTGKVAFQGVELASPLPPADDVPEVPAAVKPLTVPVRIYLDEADKRSQPVWEKALRGRLDAAADIVAAQCGVRFTFEGAGEWKTDPASRELGTVLAAFEEAAPAKGGTLHLGFTPREIKKDPDLGLTKAPYALHILLREGQPRTEAERVELLVHHLGQYLGAVRSADPHSAMRADLKDGQAARAGHRPRLDPLNVLAIRVWAGEIAAGRKPVLAELRPPARARLHALYKTIAAVHALTKSDDTQAKELAFALAPADKAEQPSKPSVAPPDAVPSGSLTPLQRGARVVVAAVVARAAANARLPASDPKRLSGDALCGEYLRVAAEAALPLDEPTRAGAFLVGCGLALDDSPLLRTNLLTRGVCAAIETADETKARLAVLNAPTIRNRRDLCQHYVVSLALVALRGEEAAELAGVAKEVLDMKGASGFSFPDLAADLAGIELAKRILTTPTRLAGIAKGFQFDLVFPDLKDLREGLNNEQFAAEYRSTDDAKFKAAMADIRGRIAKLDGFKE